MIALLIVFLLLFIIYLFLQHPQFGKLPSGERLKKIKESPNYKEGKFQNLSYTPDLAEGETYFKVVKKVLLEKSKHNRPPAIIPSQKTNLLTLSPTENVIVWFGHSSYFIQVEGKKILVDPVFSRSASPIKAMIKSFKGTDVYTSEDFPEIDYLFISHDHWDHLDYETVVQLKPKIKNIITGLGTGEHLESWGFDPRIVIEKDWNETILLDGGFIVTTTSARHFSGRGLKRNKAIWLSFVLQTPKRKLFLGGDSGYDTHFAEIGKAFGPFDLAIVECGQYNESWRYIHLMPYQMLTVARELNAKVLMPVHWAKFALANHDWDEPIRLITEAAKNENFPLLTPMIGEKVNLDSPESYNKWWEM